MARANHFTLQTTPTDLAAVPQDVHYMSDMMTHQQVC